MCSVSASPLQIESSCFGDSGGPLVSKDFFQIGIISFGNRKCETNSPIGYTKVAPYIRWINNKIAFAEGGKLWG